MTFFRNKWLCALLMPLSLLYRCVVCIRNILYNLGWLKAHRIGTFVLCVGNLTVGGTGKTVVVGYLANKLKNKKKKVVILSRGYKRESSGTVIVADGKRLLVGSKHAGDEPYFLARRLKTIPVIVDEDRWRGSLIAYSYFKPDYILLDDGFQHRRLHRDLNIISVNAISGFYNNRLLPAGPLREPLSALKRADFVWVTQFDETENWSKTERLIKKHTDKPFIISCYKPDGLVQLPSGRNVSLDFVQNQKVLIFSGIANPDGFKKTVEKLNPSVVYAVNFKDHYQFTPGDYDDINQKAIELNVDMIVTTEKDFVRLPSDIRFEKPLFYLEIQLEILRGEDALWNEILK
ncbi:tetraacyldisaccharide 4'-kinase [candidate division KSB1 bacterium]|nr:tetraacyldisaccharide 4'-kinase [candidate division KSB1 bacterium]